MIVNRIWILIPVFWMLYYTVITPYAPLAADVNMDGVIYVDSAATGANNGASWADAFTDLQDALAAAAYGDTLWLAGGTYYATADGDRSAHFDPPNGIALLGGFAGTESDAAERDWEANPTVISGDIGAPGDNSDNTFRLFILDSDTLLIDGLRVEGCNNGNNPSGLTIDNGGALHLTDAMVRARNTIFSDHEKSIVFEGESVATLINSSFEATHCVFFNNKGKTLSARDTISNIRLQYCRFFDNQNPVVYGGAQWLDHCIFYRNTGGSHGLLAGIWPGGTVGHITNCSFWKDREGEDRAFFYGGGGFNITGAVYYIENSIFVGGRMAHGIGGIEAEFDHCILDVFDYTSDIPSGVYTNTLFNQNPLYTDPENGDFRLHFCSPAVDAGRNAGVLPSAAYDLAGNARIIGGTVDIGAHEYNPEAPDNPTLITVTNTNNSGAGSLRRAIECANEHPGPDTITFNIPGSPPFVIQPLTDLPDIVGDSTVIDATTQRDWYLGSIELDGSQVSYDADAPFSRYNGNGLHILANDVEIYGLSIHHFATDGILFGRQGYSFHGMDIGRPGKGNAIFNNFMSHVNINFTPDGNIRFAGEISNVRIRSNLIGVTPSGEPQSYRHTDGIYFTGSLTNIIIGGRRSLNEENIIGACSSGLSLNGSISNAYVFGNHIGVSESGVPLGNNIGIELISYGPVTIGSHQSDHQNDFAFNYHGIYQIMRDGSSQILFRKNSFYCNGPSSQQAISNAAADSLEPIIPTILSANFAQVAGIAPGARYVDLYLADNPYCSACNSGYQFLDSVPVARDGSWSIALPPNIQVGAQLTALTIDSLYNTSEFSPCLNVCNTIVTNTENSGPGSLRFAIDCANRHPGPDTITFNLPGTPPFIIQPLTELPSIEDVGTVIDGSTQPGVEQPGDVVLDGGNLTGLRTGLRITADSCGVFGLYIRNFSEFGIQAQELFGDTLDAIRIGAPGALSGNILSNNGMGNLYFRLCQSSFIQNNQVGYMPDIASVQDPTVKGIELFQCHTIQVGGSRALGEGNLIVGNYFGGIILNDTDSLQIQGNDIGFFPTDSLFYENETGIMLANANNHTVIGGIDSSYSNTIAGNRLGVYMQFVSGQGNQVLGNAIFCNSTKGIVTQNVSDTRVPPVVSEASPYRISGNSAPGDWIEVFLESRAFCPGLNVSNCQGRFLLGRVEADTTGNWALNFAPSIGLLGQRAVATASKEGENTSEFSDCRTIACPSLITTIDTTLCYGEQFAIGSQSYAATGSYRDTLTIYGVCDSIIHLELTVLPEQAHYIDTVLCAGEELIINGNSYSEPVADGVEVAPNTGPWGCDSTIYFSIAVEPWGEHFIQETLCPGESLMANGVVYDEANPDGAEILPGGAVNGCDSIIQVQLNFYPAASAFIDTVLCQGAFIEVGAEQFHTSGSYTRILQTVNGCDSTIQLELEVRERIDIQLRDTICAGETFTAGGFGYSTTGLHRDTARYANGCDSLRVALDLLVLDEDAVGQAMALADDADCGGATLLSANLPPGTTGHWASSGAVAIDTPGEPITMAAGLPMGETAFTWALSTPRCPAYSSDTVFVQYLGVPEAEDDNYLEEYTREGYLLDPFANDRMEPGDVPEVRAQSFPGEAAFDETGRLRLLPSREEFGELLVTYAICRSGCCDEAVARLVIETPVLYPEAITPNGDGINDRFIIQPLFEDPAAYPDNELSIFDRSGGLILRASPYRNDWEGLNRRGQVVPESVYYFIYDPGNGEPVVKGRIAVLR